MNEDRLLTRSTSTNGAALLRAALFALLAFAAAAPARAQDRTPLALAPEPFPIVAHEQAHLLRRVPLLYPEPARREGISGVVVVNARVGRDGRVRETSLATSIPVLDDYALEVVRRFEFTPAIFEGGEVETWVQVPLRFDESLPTGTRNGEPVEARRYSDLERSFESEAEVLKQGEPVAPNDSTLDQHLRMMRAALELEMIPPPGAEAIQAFLRADTLARSPVPAVCAQRKVEWARAAYLAPWWPLPYRRLMSIAIAENNYETADACNRIILAGRPNDEEASATVRRIRQLRLASAVGEHRRKK